MLTTVCYLKSDDLHARVSLNNVHLSPIFDACKEMEVTTMHYFKLDCQSTHYPDNNDAFIYNLSHQETYISIVTQQLFGIWPIFKTKFVVFKEEYLSF